MTRHGKRILGITLGAVALIMVTAGASALITKEMVRPEEVKPAPTAKVAHAKPTRKRENITLNDPAPRQQPVQQVAARCDDGNVVGYGLGAVAGGLIGHQIGDGKGKDIATIGGAAAGALAGGQYIPTRGVLCR